MSRAKSRGFALLAAGAVAFGGISLPTPLGAQLSAGFSVASFQFNLSNPGARSLGMGGAFAGLADDATAAYANPAGLTILARPEISFEGRAASSRLPLVAAEPIVSVVAFPDQIDGVGVTEATPLGAPDASGTTASFASFVHPVGGWTLAVYRHQLVDLEAAGGVEIPAIEANVGDLGNTTSGATRTRALVDMNSVGVAAARRIGSRLSLGVTLVRNEASIEARRTSEFVERIRFGNIPVDDVAWRFDNRVRGRDDDLTFNAGIMFRPASRWAIGLAYRQGPSFELREVDSTTRQGETSRREFAAEPFRVPDVFGVGASLRATPSLVVSMEWSRVRYSGLRSLAAVPDSLALSGPENDPARLARLGRFSVEDVDELRAGMEYSFTRLAAAPAVRLGAWYDPAHKVRFTASAVCPGPALPEAGRYECSIGQDGGLDPADLIDQLLDATAAGSIELLFPPGDDRLHLTGGFGVVFGSRFQVDAAFDYATRDQYTLSLSGIVQF